MSSILRFPGTKPGRPSGKSEQITLLVELDGSIRIAELAGALSTVGLTISTSPRTGRLRIHAIPPFIRKET